MSGYIGPGHDDPDARAPSALTYTFRNHGAPTAEGDIELPAELAVDPTAPPALAIVLNKLVTGYGRFLNADPFDYAECDIPDRLAARGELRIPVYASNPAAVLIYTDGGTTKLGVFATTAEPIGEGFIDLGGVHYARTED